jgi:hypothetical protein
MPPRSARGARVAEGTSIKRSRSAPLIVDVGESSARGSRSSSVVDSANFLARQQAKRMHSRREKLVEMTDYRQAAKINAGLQELIGDYEALEHEKVQMKLMQENLKLIARQSEQLREFNAQWAERMRKFNRRVEYMRSVFKKEQRDAHKEHIKQIRSEKPQLKFSKPLQLLRDQADSLARLHKYDEAIFVKREAEVVEAAEIADFNAKCDHVSRLGGRDAFIKTQRNDLDVCEQKIELDWMRLNVSKREETEELLKKQAG